MEILYNYPSQPKINEILIFTIKNGRLYSVEFEGDAAYYNTFLPTAQKIIDSFRITLAIQPNDVKASYDKGLSLVEIVTA